MDDPFFASHAQASDKVTTFSDDLIKRNLTFLNTGEAFKALTKASSTFIWDTNNVSLCVSDQFYSGKVKLTLASFNFQSDVRNKDHPFQPSPTFQSQKSVLVPKTGFEFSEYKESATELIKQMAADSVNFICLPEFQFLFPERIDENELHKQYIDDIFDVIEQASHHMVIMPGSGHCPIRKRNLVPIFSKGHRSFAQDIFEKSWAEEDKEGRSEVVGHEDMMYCKRRPAYKAKEKVYAPMLYTFPVFETYFGNIAVLVCLDAADVSIINSLVSHNLDARASGTSDRRVIKYIFIPTFNKNQAIHNLAKAISMLTGAIVLYVNWSGFEDIETRNLYIAGKSYLDWQTDIRLMHPDEREQDISEKALFETCKIIKASNSTSERRDDYGWTATTYEIPVSIFRDIENFISERSENLAESVSHSVGERFTKSSTSRRVTPTTIN